MQSAFLAGPFVHFRTGVDFQLKPLAGRVRKDGETCVRDKKRDSLRRQVVQNGTKYLLRGQQKAIYWPQFWTATYETEGERCDLSSRANCLASFERKREREREVYSSNLKSFPVTFLARFQRGTVPGLLVHFD